MLTCVIRERETYQFVLACRRSSRFEVCTLSSCDPNALTDSLAHPNRLVHEPEYERCSNRWWRRLIAVACLPRTPSRETHRANDILLEGYAHPRQDSLSTSVMSRCYEATRSCTHLWTQELTFQCAAVSELVRVFSDGLFVSIPPISALHGAY